MNFKAVTTRTLGALLALTFAASAFAQEMSVGIASGQPGTQATTSIDWTGDGTVDNITVWIDFDDTVITPEVTGPNNEVVGCLDGLPASHTGILTTCRNPAATPQRIVVVISDQGGAGSFPTTNVGSINFDINAGATTGTTEPVTVSIQEATDSGLNDVTASVTATDGAVNIVAGPQSELAVTPDPMAFGTVDLGVMPVTDTFTVENIGAASANIATVGLAGPDAEFTILAENCTGPLAAGATCTVDIQFNATANGPYSNQLDITSDANVNPNPSVAITGTADSVANLGITPAPGAINLGTVFIGSSASTSGSISNTGSAAGDFSCTLSGDPEISVTPSPLSGTIPAQGSMDFTVACNVPDSAVDGDTFSAGLVCTGDNGFESTHEISCSATSFVAYPVPTMNKWGIALLALLMVMIGGISVRFFRT